MTRDDKKQLEKELVLFELGKEIYGVDISVVYEIIRMQPIGDKNRDNRIMVLESGGQNIGIIIDAVTEVLRIPSDSIEPPSNIIVSAASDYFLGIAKHDK